MSALGQYVHDRPYLLSSLGHFVVELCSNFLPVLYPIYIATANLSYSQVGVLTLIYVFFASATQPIFGYITDRWYPGRLAVLGVIWVGTLMGLTGFFTNFYALAFVIGLSALGSSIFHPSGASLTYSHTHASEGKSMAVFSVSGNLGAALSPVLIGLFLFSLNLRSTIVLIPISILAGLALTRFSFQELQPALQKVASLQAVRMPRNKALMVLALILLAVMLRSWFYLSFQTYLPTWLEQASSLAFDGGKALFILMLSVGVGSLLGGWLSDRLGHGPVLAAGLGLLGPVYWAFMLLNGHLAPLALVGVGVLVGFTFPTSIVLAQAVWPRGVGMVSAVVIGFAWVPGGVGTSITGLIADRFSLDLGLRLLVSAPILATILTLLALVALKKPGKSPASLALHP